METLLAAPWGLAFWPSGAASPSLSPEPSRSSGCPGALVLQTRESRWKGGRDSPHSERVAVPLTGEAERKKACQGLPGRGP